MIKKLKINTQQFLVPKSFNKLEIQNKKSELNYKHIFNFFKSGKINLRKRKVRKNFKMWFFSSKHDNGYYHFRKVKPLKLFFLKSFWFLNNLNKLNKKKLIFFYSTYLNKSYLLWSYIPRIFHIFLLNNQEGFVSDYSNQFSNIDNSTLQSKNHLLLKKKTPKKPTLINYLIFYRTFFLFYIFVSNKSTNLYERKKPFNKFLYIYIQSLHVFLLSNQFI